MEYQFQPIPDNTNPNPNQSELDYKKSYKKSSN